MSEKTDTYFEIDASTAKLVKDGEQVAEVNAHQFTDALYGNDIGMLPPAVRWISDSAPWVLLLERPPQLINLLRDDDTEMKLHMPWTLWVMEISTTRELRMNVFARNDALYSFHESVYHLPLPGIDPSGTVTDFSYTLKDGQAIGYQLPEAIDATYRHLGGQVDEKAVEHPPEGWPADSYEALLTYWSEQGPADIADHPFAEVKGMEVEDLTTRGSDDAPDTVFELMESIITHIDQGQEK